MPRRTPSSREIPNAVRACWPRSWTPTTPTRCCIGTWSCSCGPATRRPPTSAYDRVAERLHRTAGLEPPEPAAALAARLKGGHVAAPATDLVGVVGRIDEVSELAGLLGRPECRLLTLLGPGGIGKSTLARLLVRRAASIYADGAAVVSLETVADPGDVPSRVATDLGMGLEPSAERGEQLLGVLRRQQRLLVLDNVEHLPSVWPFFAEMLDACPRIDLVVTSRERLRLAEEWVYQVDGMTDDDAVELLGQRAFRVAGLHDLDRDEALGVCRVVGGSPLGIELAAPWLRVMSAAEVVAQIGGDAALLSGAGTDAPARHRSIDAAMAHSWRLATPNEREVIEALASFSAPFTRELAAEVADATPLVLRDLVDKSLLRAHPGGRYGFHPLVRQHAAGRLAADPDRHSRARDRHARAVLRMLANTDAATVDGDVLEDAVRAWRHAIATTELDLAASATEALVRHLTTAGRCRQGLDLLGSVPDDVRSHPTLTGAVACGRAQLLLSTGRHEEAAEAAERALRAAGAAGDDRVRVLAGLALGWARKWTEGDDAQYAVTCQVLPVAEALHDDAVLAEVFNSLGCSAPTLEECRDHLLAGVAAAERADRPLLLGTCTHNLGSVLWGLGETESAVRYLRDTLAMARSGGIRWALISSLTMLAFVHGERDELDLARRLAAEAEDLAHDSEFADYNTGAILVAGEISRLAGDLEGARSRVRAALKVAVGQDKEALALRALRLHGLTLLDEGREDEGLEVLAFVLPRVARKGDWTSSVINPRIWADLATRVDHERIARARARASERRLDDLVTLALTRPPPPA